MLLVPQTFLSRALCSWAANQCTCPTGIHPIFAAPSLRLGPPNSDFCPPPGWGWQAGKSEAGDGRLWGRSDGWIVQRWRRDAIVLHEHAGRAGTTYVLFLRG